VGRERRVNRPIPVALFAFRRADLLARTLAALHANGVPRIYAFSDGARDGADEADIAEVRRMLRAVDWAEISVVEREKNLGLSASIISGISEVLALHDAVIVCEDDIEFAPGTNEYMLAALERYGNEQRVMCISGWTHPRMTPANAHDAPHFTGRFSCWGWATWRRAWDGFADASAVELRDRCAARGIDIGKYGEDVAGAFVGDAAGATWDYRFNLHMLLRDGLSLLPPRTMTSHIGYGERASNAGEGVGWEDHPESPPPPDAVRWPAVVENPLSAECWRRAQDPPPRPSLLRRIARRLARVVGSAADS
jgi:glycosyltransferase involved in cell wall biosynthesis